MQLNHFSPVTTPPSSTGRDTQYGCRPSWSLDVHWCSVCCVQPCWCHCEVPACTAPPWFGSRAFRTSYCKGSNLPPPTCQYSRHFESFPCRKAIALFFSFLALNRGSNHAGVDIQSQSHFTCNVANNALRVEGHLRGLAALLNIATLADGFGLFAGFTKVTVHQAAVTLPPAPIFCVLYA